jgi:hypothetical protein
MDVKANIHQGPLADPVRPGGCEEKEGHTQKCISGLRQVYCTNLRSTKTDRESSEKAYERSVKIYKKKKKLFQWTEKNYRLYRDFDICIDNELTSGNTSLTANVAVYSALSQTLYTNLKSVVTSITDLKTKVGLLRDAASNLDNYKNDQANATQWTLLTGKTMDNCKPDGEPPPQRERPEACKDADVIYHELIAIPKRVLVFDANSLLQSATDTVGIQTFTNIDILTSQQVLLTTASTALVTQIQATLKLRTADIVTTQADLVTSVQECTTTGVDKYNKSCIYDGAYHTVKFLCCPDCKCVRPHEEGSHHPHLADCECKICKIGEVVKNVYRGEARPEGEEDCGC